MARAPRYLSFDHLHHPDGWLSPGHLVVGADGFVVAVAGSEPDGWDRSRAEHLHGYGVPGMPNLHSHAFQRAIAGSTEHASQGGDGDSFWTWRERMYAFAERIDPEQMQAITAQVQVEMLEAGMTAVGEFHYLHHGRGGQRYADPTEMSWRILAAAEQTGIAVTLLPVLYTRGGFGRPIAPEQRRFAHDDVADFLSLCELLAERVGTVPRHRVGVAPHSLRAVGEAELRAVVQATAKRDPAAPIHVHVAEQRREVEECQERLGARPVARLCGHDDLGIDARWCLVHATHIDPDERRAIATRGAVVGLCPTTEANLGDGVFPLVEFLADGGAFGIGSDSQVSVSVREELRLLEYGQRLRHGARNVTAAPGPVTARHVGRRLFDLAVKGGAQALAQPVGVLVPGARADVVVLDPAHPRLSGHRPATVLDAFVFSSGSGPAWVRDVFVAGERVVEGARHVRRDAVRAEFDAAMRRLLQEVDR